MEIQFEIQLINLKELYRKNFQINNDLRIFNLPSLLIMASRNSLDIFTTLLLITVIIREDPQPLLFLRSTYKFSVHFRYELFERI